MRQSGCCVDFIAIAHKTCGILFTTVHRLSGETKWQSERDLIKIILALVFTSNILWHKR